MLFELWGFDLSLSLGLPVRSSGYVVLAVGLLLSAIVILSDLIRRLRQPSAEGGRPLLFLVLLILAPFASQLLTVQLPALAGLPLPGMPQEAPAPAATAAAAR